MREISVVIMMDKCRVQRDTVLLLLQNYYDFEVFCMSIKFLLHWLIDKFVFFLVRVSTESTV